MLSEQQIWHRLRSIFSTTLGRDDIILTPETTARDIPGWDSVTNVQLMVAIEHAFSIRFRTGELAHVENVGQLVQRISRRISL
jgi:acyl carrier protein